jgi:toxin ParE1/3/4
MASKSKLEITPEAEQDILLIATEIRLQNNAATARQRLTEIKNQLKALAKYPDSGRVGGCEGTREIVMSGMPYIAIYEQSDASVIVVRVLRGAAGNQPAV